MRVLLAAITCEKGEIETNLARHVSALNDAREAGCDLAVFPEFSLTGSVDPTRHPERAVGLDDSAVQRMVAAAHDARVGALFGLAERRGNEFFITQAYAISRRIAGVQRKRHLGEDEVGFGVSSETAVFEYGAARFGAIICAESGPDFTWDANTAAGASVTFLCAAPGLYGRRTDKTSWRAGIEWWESDGLANARRNAQRLGQWVGMATQAGATVDEDFPGIAALIAPTGEIVERTPDWRPGSLIVDIPVATDVEPVRHAVRVLVVDNEGRTLLTEFGDDLTGRRWWVPPGGGIENGEDDFACARRELLEEVGRDDIVVGVCIGRRGGSFPIEGGWLTQYERWFVARCEHFEVADDVVARVRPEGIRSVRWWSSDELRAAHIDTGPRNLPDLLDAIVSGRYPPADTDLGR
jgi:predicted amidohydrolase